jgi:hypothetical protein
MKIGVHGDLAEGREKDGSFTAIVERESGSL